MLYYYIVGMLLDLVFIVHNCQLCAMDVIYISMVSSCSQALKGIDCPWFSLLSVRFYIYMGTRLIVEDTCCRCQYVVLPQSICLVLFSMFGISLFIV